MKPLSLKAAIYLRAAELVEKGWCQHRLYKGDPYGKRTAWCYRGAVIEAEAEMAGVSFVTAVFSDAPPFSAGDGWDERINWNNAPQRTQAEVAARLREEAFKE